MLHNQLAFLQQEVAQADLANILAPTPDSKGSADILRRSPRVGPNTLAPHWHFGTPRRGHKRYKNTHNTPSGFTKRMRAPMSICVVSLCMYQEDEFLASLMGSYDLDLVVSPSVATVHEGPRLEGALVVVGDPRADEKYTAQVLHRFIVAERVQRKKEEALRADWGHS